MTDMTPDDWVSKVWEEASSLGIESPPLVRDAHGPMLQVLAEAGATPAMAAACIERQVQVALAQFNVLVDSLQLISDATLLATRALDGEETDPISVGYELTKQQAGIAALHDEIARIAPLAGIGEGWNQEETARTRAEAEAQRDGFLDEIQAIADGKLNENR